LSRYRRAAEGGCIGAYYSVGKFYRDGTGVGRDRAEALRWFERAAEGGIPDAHRQLAEFYEVGDQLGQNFEKALFHHAIEMRLFDAAGDEPNATIARARRSSLAHAVPPEIAIRVVQEAAQWRPKDP
jgi:TPR repeat protein